MSAIRVILVGGSISFRALFNWRHPSVYVPTVLAKPIFQLVFFTLLARQVGIGSTGHFVVGNAIQAGEIAGIYGMVMAFVNDRQFGTIGPVLASTSGRIAVFFGRTLPIIGHSFMTSIVVMTLGGPLVGFLMPLDVAVAFAVVALLTAITGTMLGLVVGAVAMRLNDLWVTSNLTYNLMILLTGCVIPPTAMPDWLTVVSQYVPLTHGIEAARLLAAGSSFGQVRGLLAYEAMIGAGYASIGLAVLVIMCRSDRREATIS